MRPGFVLAAGCFSLFAIIMFCVILGGYSSFTRAQNRIEASKSFLTDACQKKLDLLPALFEITKKSVTQTSIQEINQAAQKAAAILQQVISQKPPLDTQLVKEFELSQIHLTNRLIDLFPKLEASLDQNDLKQFEPLKQQFYTAQDTLFVIWKSYINEVVYFNSRTVTFPNFLIAKLFGFNKIHYAELSPEAFLPARKTFNSQAS